MEYKINKNKNKNKINKNKNKNKIKQIKTTPINNKLFNFWFDNQILKY